MTKLCRTCLQAKPLAAFSVRRQSKDGLSAKCRECSAVYKRSLVERDPDYERNRALWRYYRMTPEQYEARLATQGGGCAVCGANDKRLHVDHDHSCCPGKVTCGQCIRGLLCGDCNLGLGCFEDDPVLVSQALDYLKRGVC